MPTTHSIDKRWSVHPSDADRVASLREALGVPAIVATLLANRKIHEIEEARRHLEPNLKRLHDPFLLPGMKVASERLVHAIENQEMILVHGDYDVDGVTGTSLLMRLFDLLGAKAEWHIPNRFTDGYSFGPHSVERAAAVGARVVVSVDNGTSAVETIRELAQNGVETIVTDHHEPPQGDLPEALAIVNPKLASSEYPFRELCGGAVAFKLAWGVCQTLSGSERVRNDLRDFLVDAMSYVAIATICDVVPLIDENRLFARFGLRALEQSATPGLRAMLGVTGLRNKRLVAEDVGFQIGPRINASGRLGSAHSAVELLLASDDAKAKAAAQSLDDMNIERKRIERELLDVAFAEAERFADAERWPVLLIAGQGWHQGVIGIIAARLVDHFHRPAIVIGLDGDEGRGSARSVQGFSVLEAMHGGADHMLRYGGHAQAAGCEVQSDSIDALRESICERARQILADEGLPQPEVRADARIPFEHMTVETMNAIDRLEPFGEHNEAPVFISTDLRLAELPRIVGADATHMILKLRQGAHSLKALAFNQASRAPELALGVPIHVAYTPRWNTFRGETNLELLIEDFKIGDAPQLD